MLRCWRFRDGSALAVSIDCNGRRVAADPYTGTVEAVLECAANLACVGAEPLGTTNNLNFGNPEKGHIAWQLTESVRGLGDACRALESPDRGRQRVALQRELTRRLRRADLPDAGDRHGRPPAGRLSRRPARVFKGWRHGRARSALSPRRWPRASWPSCAATSCRTACRTSTSGRFTPRSSRSAAPCASARCPAPTTSPRGVSPPRSPSAALRGASGRTCGSSQPARAIHSLPSSVRVPAASWSAARPTVSARWAVAPPRASSARSAATALLLTLGDLTLCVTLAELAEAHSALAELFG